MKNIVIIGASDFVGSAILNEALGRGHKVTAVVRNPEKIKRTDPNLTVAAGNVSCAGTVAELAKEADAVISAYNPGWSNPNIYEETLETYPAIISGVKGAGVKRLLIVGGAGSLNVAPGVRVMDGPLPASVAPGIKALAEVYYTYLLPEKELDWVFLSPAANMQPGKRTGKFRLGKDDLIVDAKGESRISVEDYAVAMIDELEKEAHHRERFTLGY